MAKDKKKDKLSLSKAVAGNRKWLLLLVPLLVVILQYMPVGDEDPEMLYVNGKALLDAYPEGIDQVPTARWNNMFNSHPTHMTPRLPRTELGSFGDAENIYSECLLGLGSTPLPEAFIGSLLRRRLHYWGVQTGMLGTLQHCETYAP
ncbi:uncharacterized protein KRP23_13398 [Phytophthora ramorum]|uniref:uncharacterized protein n=1 Tax=Phytophthora ramorum TaxID=164328 RepID=UPI0030A6D802|nr:hypothetical protein KRP23_13398 [Phytophthora ramorum]